MIAPINLTAEYRRQRQDAIRRKQKFGMTDEPTSITTYETETFNVKIPWLDDYACAHIAINNLQETYEQQVKNYEAILRSRRPGLSHSMDRQVLTTANLASQRINEAEILLSKIASKDETMPESELRMRLNAAKFLTLRLKKAVNSYNEIHKKVMALQTQESTGEIELTLPTGAKSPPPDERLKTQLLAPQASEQLFSSNQIGQMHELMQVVAQMFSSANELVIEQGSMLDRIDQNVDIAIQKTLQSKQQIKKAVYNQKHGFAKQTIVLLLTLNFLMLLLNGMKFYFRF